MSDRVLPNSLVTLHYSMALPSGQIVISTFDATPATLQLGQGEMSTPLEACLIGMQAGQRQSFTLEPGQAFGWPVQARIERLSRRLLPADAQLTEGALIELMAPDKTKLAARVVELDAESVLLDFNHPLAGKAVVFDVQVVGIC